jgi:hypothetical protein
MLFLDSPRNPDSDTFYFLYLVLFVPCRLVSLAPENGDQSHAPGYIYSLSVICVRTHIPFPPYMPLIHPITDMPHLGSHAPQLTPPV